MDPNLTRLASRSATPLRTRPSVYNSCVYGNGNGNVNGNGNCNVNGNGSGNGQACYSTPPQAAVFAPPYITPASFPQYHQHHQHQQLLAASMPSAMPSAMPFPTPYGGYVSVSGPDDGMGVLFGETTLEPISSVSAAADNDAAGLDFGLDLVDHDVDLDLALDPDLDLNTGMDLMDPLPLLDTSLPLFDSSSSNSIMYSGGDATMSSPSASARGDVQSTAANVPTVPSSSSSSSSSYPDPTPYASTMPPPPPPPPTVSTPALPPFALPMPTYTAGQTALGQVATAGQVTTGSPAQPAQIETTPDHHHPFDPSDWRARLRYCEAAPNKALLEASMVRLLDFSDAATAALDERELAERRAANLRFDKIREQRLKDRNNEAAKRSRQRKVARIEAAEQQIAGLQRERALLVSEVVSLRRRLAGGRDSKDSPNDQKSSRNGHTEEEA